MLPLRQNPAHCALLGARLSRPLFSLGTAPGRQDACLEVAISTTQHVGVPGLEWDLPLLVTPQTGARGEEGKQESDLQYHKPITEAWQSGHTSPA